MTFLHVGHLAPSCSDSAASMSACSAPSLHRRASYSASRPLSSAFFCASRASLLPPRASSDSALKLAASAPARPPISDLAQAISSSTILMRARASASSFCAPSILLISESSCCRDLPVGFSGTRQVPICPEASAISFSSRAISAAMELFLFDFSSALERAA